MRHCHTMLSDWGRWIAQYNRSGLGYPTSTTESRAGEGRGPRQKATVPRAMMDQYVAEVDRAVREMPGRLRRQTEIYYVECERIGSRSYTKTRVKEIHRWLNRHLNNKMRTISTGRLTT